MKSIPQNIRFPLASLILLLLSFGLMIPFLGAYWDDWPVILAARQLGVKSFWAFYAGERPFSAWTYLATIPILGTTPVVWHIFSLLLRWLTVLGMWWTLLCLWPGRKREVTWMALLFAVYPVFTEQSVSVAFSQHWITYGLFFLSLGAMLQAYRTPRLFWPLTIMAIFAGIVHALTLEYFWGLEFLRPVLLWIVIGEQENSPKKRLKKTLRRWFPFLLVLFLAVFLRFFVFVDPNADPNRPVLLYGFGSQPFQTFVRLVQISIQDLVNNLIGVWYQSIAPAEIDFTNRGYLFSFVLFLFVSGLMIYYLNQEISENGQTGNQSKWIRQAIILGLLGAMLGPLPVWFKDRQVIYGMYSGRFALAGMFGLSILFVALLEWFAPRRWPKILFVAILVGLAAGYHMRISNSYYKSTLKQNNFYWQLYWRAPYLKPGTAILSADELFPYVGRNPTATALNLLYPQPDGIAQMGYWFLELYQGIGPKQVPKLVRDKLLSPSFRNFFFQGSSLDSLVIFYKPGGGRCLWVLSPDDFDVEDLPELTLQALPVSNLSRIERNPISDGYPPTELFGQEPEHTWCYYYQKIELARQAEDWQTVIALGDEALGNGFSPENPYERLSLVEGYLINGRWQDARKMIQAAYDGNPDVAPRVCRIVERVSQANGLSEEAKNELREILYHDICQLPP